MARNPSASRVTTTRAATRAAPATFLTPGGVLTKVTQYVVQPFIERDGELVADEPFHSKVKSIAMLVAETLVTRKAGVVFYLRTGDPDTGEWDDDRMILFRAGKTTE